MKRVRSKYANAPKRYIISEKELKNIVKYTVEEFGRLLC